MRNWVIFVFFSYFFCISALDEGFGVYFRGVFQGSEGFVFVFVWGTYDRKFWGVRPFPSSDAWGAPSFSWW